MSSLEHSLEALRDRVRQHHAENCIHGYDRLDVDFVGNEAIVRPQTLYEGEPDYYLPVQGGDGQDHVFAYDLKEIGE